jgi:hypothetical protein
VKHPGKRATPEETRALTAARVKREAAFVRRVMFRIKQKMEDGS